MNIFTGKTVAQLSEEISRNAGEPVLKGHDFMGVIRFDENTHHMIIFDVLKHECPVGAKGDRMRLFLSNEGYQKSLESQQRAEIKIQRHAKVSHGNVIYDRPPIDMTI